MALPDSFIAFCDLSPDARILWISPSGYSLFGYEPEDVVGKPAFEVIYPDEHADVHQFLEEYTANDLIASQIVIRYLTKDGRKILCALLGCVCYDFAVYVLKVQDPDVEKRIGRWAHSTTMNRRMGSKKEFEGMKLHHQASENAWNNQAMEPEARVCLIINRYTRGLTIMYASSACEKVLHVDPDDITGKPILLYVRSDDLAPFVEQVDLAKTTTTISQMRFWFQSPNTRQPIPCEAVIIGTSDGIMALIRKCKPFVRKHFIGSQEQYENQSQGSSVSTRWTASSYSSTLVPGPSESPSASPFARPNDGYSGPGTPSPSRNVPREALNRIRIVELDDEGPSQRAESNDDCTEASKALPFQEVVVQDYHEEEDSFEDDDVDTVVRGVAISRLDDNNVSN
ncbi:hypothetical protein B0O80DRAFT_495885 [Mortierella sp. GBAus27b]|nr:hypothetical protein B0O80DRAFT_495885 [Mortierella sp. GBAus27b]